MPWNVSKTASGVDKEILKFPTGLHAIKSIVLDATDLGTFTFTDGVRNYVPAGTILKLSTTNADKYVAYKGSGTIAGVLAHGVDMANQATSGSEPAPMFFHECVFATEAIVGFTNYASALVNDLKTCKFE